MRPDHHRTPLSTVRLDEQEQQTLIDRLDRKAAASPGREKRRAERQAFPKGVGLTITLDGSATRTALRVRGWNISRLGVGFLHGQFMYPGSGCAIELTMDGREATVRGKVRRCVYLEAGVHEVGVSFDAPFELEAFLGGESPDPAAGNPTVPPVKLHGSVLFTDDSEASRRLVSHRLGQLGLDVVEAGTLEQAIKLLKRHTFDLLLCDLWLDPDDGLDLVRQARRMGLKTPVVVITADARDETTERIVREGCQGIIHKPVSLHDLADLLKGILEPPPEPTGATLVSTVWKDAELRPLITRFVYELERQLEHIDERLLGEKLGPQGTVYHRCLQIAADAEAYGYPPIANLARNLLVLIEHGAETAEVQGELAQLRRRAIAAKAAV